MGLITDVRREIGEASAVFWTDQQIADALNEAQVCLIAEQPTAITTSVPFVLPATVDIVSVPSSIMIPRYVLDEDSRQVHFSSRSDLENYSKSWWNVTDGKPKTFVIVQYNLVRMWPRPDQVYTYTMYGTPWPTEITTSVSTTTHPHMVENALIAYAVGVLMTPTRPELAGTYFTMYYEYVAKHMLNVRGTFGVNTRRIRPTGKLGAAQRGSIHRRGTYPWQ